MAEADSIADSLLRLGDPSGRQDQGFWDEWFQQVCCDANHRSFEWYTSPEEVIRVASHHLHLGDTTTDEKQRRMIHPGSGTSRVPLSISESYPECRHVVVEVSPKAIHEMKEHHDKEFLSRIPTLQSCPVDYILADLLQPSPLDLAQESFDAWIDKGFVDAVFSEKNHDKNRKQADYLFREAHRLLAEQGIVLIVTLAEQHSLDLILENWMACDADGFPLWSSLHMWDMKPVSGEMLPFGFVLVKSSLPVSESRFLVHHSLDGKEAETAVMPDTVATTVSEYVSQAREAFSRAARHEAQRYLLTTLDIKPYGTETDLVDLGKCLRSMAWQFYGPNGLQQLKPVWQAMSTDDDQVMEQVIPIGFGVSKLRLKCIIHADEVDDLVAAIEEWEGDDVVEGVQSVDVDWDKSVAIADISTVRRIKR